MLGLPDVPAFEVVLGRRRHMGRIVDDGRRADPAELKEVVVGPGVPDSKVEVVEGAGSPVAVLTVSDFGANARLTWEPRRDTEGIVTALALTLASALLGGGEVLDMDHRLVEGSVAEPAAFVAATRLPPHVGDRYEAALRYLRQFPSLEGWPLS